MHDQLEAPLEKIYSALADERDLRRSIAKRPSTPRPTISPSRPRRVPRRHRRPSPPPQGKSPPTRRCGVLFSRQWKILIADPLNIAFLFAQAVIISVLIAWASDDIGMRAFITVIAAMWFGCSNAAQQIIGEILIVQRERVCGLGLNTYYFSKLTFLSLLTAAQTFLLLVCTTGLGNLWHPEEFNRDDFAERLTSRVTARAGIEDS